MENVPCVFVDYLTEAQKKAYILADNRFALDAGWDEDMLRVEMEALQGMDFDVSLTGFDESEIVDLLSLDDGEAKEDDFDVDAELQKPCVARAMSGISVSIVLSAEIPRCRRHTSVCSVARKPTLSVRTRRILWLWKARRGKSRTTI